MEAWVRARLCTAVDAFLYGLRLEFLRLCARFFPDCPSDMVEATLERFREQLSAEFQVRARAVILG